MKDIPLDIQKVTKEAKNFLMFLDPKTREASVAYIISQITNMKGKKCKQS